MTPVRMRLRAALAMLLLPLTGCALDPYSRDGVWRPSAVNETNLRAMVADPRDLQQGVGDRGANGQLAGAAVRRLLEDRLRPLPSASSTATNLGGGSN